jgi:hypothetical protein
MLGRWHEDERLAARARRLAEASFGNPASHRLLVRLPD